MNKLKVDTVVRIFCQNLEIENPRYISIICELMENIITKYEKIGISEVEDYQLYVIKSDNNKYSIEDFFLNRLLFNIRSFEIKGSGGRADYNPGFRSITLNRNKLSTLLDRYSTYKFTDEQKYLAGKKVVMHEFEHALQTQFEQNINVNDFVRLQDLYTKLSSSNLDINLNEIYDGRKLMPYHGAGNKKSSGLMKTSGDDVYRQYAGTFYKKKNGFEYENEDNVNEIFNESEALVLSGSNQNVPIFFNSGNGVNVKNVESSNYLITNYAFMLKMLLGEKNVFLGMYVDRKNIVDNFNAEYGEIFNQIFKKHLHQKYPNMNWIDGWSMLYAALGEIKYSNQDGARDYCDLCNEKLNLALALCFEDKVNKMINIGVKFEELKQLWNEFTSFALYNHVKEKNDKLSHVIVLNRVKDIIKQTKNNVDENQSEISKKAIK